MDKQIEINVSIVYCREDKTFRNELILHLKILKRQGMINNWLEREILPARQWDSAPIPALNNSDIVLMVTSPALLGSGYLSGSELKKAMELHKADKLDLIPVIFKECAWEAPPLEQTMPLPESGKPVISSHWNSMDEAFVNIDKALKRLIQRRKEKKEAGKAAIQSIIKNQEKEPGIHGEPISPDIEKVIESPHKVIYPRDNKDAR
jgi:hypothetical protein